MKKIRIWIMINKPHEQEEDLTFVVMDRLGLLGEALLAVGLAESLGMIGLLDSTSVLTVEELGGHDGLVGDDVEHPFLQHLIFNTDI